MSARSRAHRLAGKAGEDRAAASSDQHALTLRLRSRSRANPPSASRDSQTMATNSTTPVTVISNSAANSRGMSSWKPACEDLVGESRCSGRRCRRRTRRPPRRSARARWKCAGRRRSTAARSGCAAARASASGGPVHAEQLGEPGFDAAQAQRGVGDDREKRDDASRTPTSATCVFFTR